MTNCVALLLCTSAPAILDDFCNFCNFCNSFVEKWVQLHTEVDLNGS